jgi:hypothetical protein
MKKTVAKWKVCKRPDAELSTWEFLLRKDILCSLLLVYSFNPQSGIEPLHILEVWHCYTILIAFCCHTR